MDKEEAIQLAIEALEYMTTELYEGEEYDDPDIQAFVKKQEDASRILQTL